MKDTLIINSISKIYFSIVSFFIFIILTLSVTYLFLNSGISLKNISLDSVRIDKLYINWDEKLNIYIQDINISKNNSSSSFNIKNTKLLKHINKIVYLPIILESITVENISYNDMQGNLHYTQKDGGSFNMASDSVDFNSTITSNQKYLNIKINSFKNKNIDLSISGNIVLDATKNMFFVNSKIDLKDQLSLDLNIKSNSKRVDYAIDSNKNIPSTSYIVSILDIDPRVAYWIDDAINMDYFEIKQAYGFVEYNKPSDTLKNFYVYGVADSLKYTYDQKLDSIKTEYTELVFKDGVLFILPNSSNTYSFDLDASWLRIDFTQPKEILTLHLLFDGIVNQDLKGLLERYKIKLPFIQNSGSMDANLILAVNLISLEVDAKGEFYTDKANFNYLGLDLDLRDTLVELDNLDIKIPMMKARYKDLADANVSAQFDLKNSKGFIDFDISKIHFSDNFFLDTQKESLKARYVIDSNKDTVEIDDSNWVLFDKKAQLENFDIPFDLESLGANIPTVEFKSDDIFRAYISGFANFKDSTFDLDLVVTKFRFMDMELDQSAADLKANYTNNVLRVSSDESINLYHKKQKIKLDNIELVYKDNSIELNNSNVEFENFFSSNFDVGYSFESEDGYVNLNRFSFANNALQSVFKIDNRVNFKIKSSNNQLIANSSSLNISAFHTDKQWVIAFNSLDKLQPYSSLLDKYKIDKGTFSLYKQTGEQSIRFIAKIDYDYDLLYKNNIPVSKYIINGVSNKKNKTYISLNDQVSIDIQDSNINIKGTGVEFNIAEATRLIDSIDSKDENSSDYSISANLIDSKIVLNDSRRILADKISLQYLNNTTTAQLKHKNGEAGFKYKDKNFHLYGAGFGDQFMENLFSMSKFNGGNLDFSINGNIDNFSGVAFMKDTRIKEFRLLNNVLAFVNTIPSLVTFSLPSYSSKGLYAQTAYMIFSYDNEVYDISDFSLESDELDILGKGKISVANNNIDMTINLKTDLASAASKIPVVGYILFNKDNISTSVKVDGKLDDPNIKSMIAKEIIVAPLNIIKRTLMLPFSVFKDD